MPFLMLSHKFTNEASEFLLRLVGVVLAREGDAIVDPVVYGTLTAKSDIRRIALQIGALS